MRRRLRELLLWAGAVLGLLAIATGVAVAFLGFSFLVFRSGSMEPEIPTGGLALSRTVDAEDLRIGDVVSVVAGNGERITHRVVDTTVRDGEATLVLKGDANATPDSEAYVVGSAERVVASVPFGGYVVAHALTPPGLLAVGCLSLMLLVVGFSRADDEDDELPQRSARTRRSGLRVARPTPTRIATALVVGTTVLAATLAATGVSGTRAAFTDAARMTTSSTSTKYFTCDAAVRGAGNPYLYWKFNETTTTVAADSSGNGRTGQLYGTASISTSKACAADTGTAATFDGSSGHVGAPEGRAAVAGPQVFSVSIWFRTNTTTGGKLLGFGNARTGLSTQYDRHLLMTDGGKVAFGVYPNAVRLIVSPLSYNDNGWHHAVGTLSSAGMRLYLDGALVASDPATTTAESFQGYWRAAFDNVNSWPSQPSSPYFRGTLDEVAVYTTALSAAEIAAMYRAAR